ncbi:nitronate monooxygenase [Fictibacillus halophilus]|uniref:Probable nitronate monooxygenase n=1 Tax=Fictibacillus halophilus TaxID=1610490 RepID=A0ABV2LLF1_9BACL|nr:nitronate monooxygenase [Fictibacillus halophilus]
MICSMLNIKYPIIQAGMAGGPTTPELVAEVSEAGALGTLGAGYMTPQQIETALRDIQQLTQSSIAVNLFLPQTYDIHKDAILGMQQYLNTYRVKLGITEVNNIPDMENLFEEQLATVIEAGVKIVSFTFEAPTKRLIEELHASEIIVIATATSVEEAIQLEANGVDLIVAQGAEAGGHRGTFLNVENESMIGTMALVPQMVDAVSCPVVAAGGIMDGRGMAAALALGAKAVQLGTAFLTVKESGAPNIHKQTILSSRDTDTKITKVFSGKSARGFKNTMMIDLENRISGNPPPYPLQHILTSDIRKEAAKQGNKELMSMWAGQASGLAKVGSAGDLVENLVGQCEDALQRISWI